MLLVSEQYVETKKGPTVKIDDPCVILSIWSGMVANYLTVTSSSKGGPSLSGLMPVVQFAVTVTAIKLL